MHAVLPLLLALTPAPLPAPAAPLDAGSTFLPAKISQNPARRNSVPPPRSPSKIPPAGAARKLDRGLEKFSGRVEVFVRMKEQLLPGAGDYEAFTKKHAGARRRELRASVLEDLHRFSDRSFARIRDLVHELEKGGDLRGLRRYFVVNGFAALANAKACQKLAAHEETAFLYRKPLPGLPSLTSLPPRGVRPPSRKAAKARRALFEATLERLAEEAPPFDPARVEATWNLSRLKVPEAWKRGFHGQGVVIALLDSGLLPTAPLTRALWRNIEEELNGEDDDGNGYVDDLFGWNFAEDSNFVLGDDPRRILSHGTACAGILASRPVETGGRILAPGVAPGARLMVLRGMGRMQAYEYALEKGADVISMSYMWVRLPLGNWRGLYRLAHEHMAAAGLVQVGGAGNFGKGGRRPAPPGKQIALPKDIPCVLAAAGILKDGTKAPASSEGPCTWDDVVFYGDYDEAHPLQKPDVTAFFTGYPVWVPVRRKILRRVRWSVVWKGEDGMGLVIGPAGNSFSGPQTGGVVALMLSANPDLPVWEVQARLRASAVDLGPKGWDPTFGAGLLDADKACKLALDYGRDGGR